VDAQQELQYDVAPDGRFLINMKLESAAAPITAVDELDARGEEVASPRIIPLWSRSSEESDEIARINDAFGWRRTRHFQLVAA